MKKLGKLKLHKAILLNDNEMKSIVGGQYNNSACRCTGTGCSGSCPDKVVGSYATGFRLIAQTCKAETVWNSNYTVGTEICVCK
jgi:natural product precursor